MHSIHYYKSRISIVAVLISLLSSAVITNATKSSIGVNKQVLNLSNLLGSRTNTPAYERILSQPVFQVTTAWGSPYMLFEKYKDEEKSIEMESSNNKDDVDRFSRAQQKDSMEDTRPVSLYFMDEHDARALADEMKQMKHMKESDLRITCTSLGKAVRMASNLGNGLPTGQPINDNTGNILSMDEGGCLRHKIVPSKRELFYAARCQGRERIGCFGDSTKDDADLLLQPQDVIEANKMGLRRQATRNAANRMKKLRQLEKEGLVESDTDKIRREYGHMEGQVGLPVFYSEGLLKKPPLIRRVIQGSKSWATSSLTPLYFSYEDLMKDWSTMRSKSVNKNKIPATPPNVEVFNMMDVVTSIDKDQWKTERRSELVRERKGWVGKIPVVHHLFKGKGTSAVKSGLDKVVFVPSSLGIQAKGRISEYGSMKARLRPMRAWGKNA